MISTQAWVIRIWSRVIRTSDEAPAFFTVTPNDLIFWLRHHWLHSWFLFQRRRNFFLSELQFSKNRQSEFFFQSGINFGTTDDISQQTENKNNYREIFRGTKTDRKTGGIFFSVDRTQFPKMMVILEARVAIIFVFSVSESESVELQLSLRNNLSLYFTSLRSRIRCHSKLQVGEWTRFDRRIYGYWFLMTWILIGV